MRNPHAEADLAAASSPILSHCSRSCPMLRDYTVWSARILSRSCMARWRAVQRFRVAERVYFYVYKDCGCASFLVISCIQGSIRTLSVVFL